ncbi:DUF3592 domain-containing protein [Chitinophaga arvensicola]|uniref:DUF3592 domain-containing protein n=1 Tax=Chitinophaga arvensicola TaxID=29529 RepID=A0A1I0S892_9BACT|nr:DUF3592 domain-containing protein [Chitinophaga arvensicola]SEW52193.1 Protein of unknown function [Chitinophaga arvensicola]
MKRSSVSLVFNIFLAVGVLMLVIAAVISYSIQKFDAGAVKTTGHVVDLIQRGSSGSRGGSTYSPVVIYTDNKGQEHRYTPSFSSNPPGYKVGEFVGIYYDPKNPDEAKMVGWSEYIGAMIAGGLGFVFGAIGLGYHLVRRRNSRRHAQLLQSGQLIQADFLSVEVNRFVHVNHRHPFYIRCEGKNPLTGRKSSFKSGFIWSDPTPYMALHKKLDVYVDQQNDRRYYVDISFLEKN